MATGAGTGRTECARGRSTSSSHARAIRLARQQELTAAQERPRISAFGRVGYGQPGLNFISDEFGPYGLAGVQVQWKAGPGARRREREALRASAADRRGRARRRSPTASHVRSRDEPTTIDRLRTSARSRRPHRRPARNRWSARPSARFQEGVVTASEYLDRSTELLVPASRRRPPGGAGAGERATAHDARTGGAVMRAARAAMMRSSASLPGLAGCAPRAASRTPTATSKRPTSWSAPKRAASCHVRPVEEGQTLAAGAVGRHHRSDPARVSSATRLAAQRDGHRVAGATRSPRQLEVVEAQRDAATAQRDAARAQRSGARRAARDRPPGARADPAAVRTAGGHRAAARSGGARRPRARPSRSRRRTSRSRPRSQQIAAHTRPDRRRRARSSRRQRRR